MTTLILDRPGKFSMVATERPAVVGVQEALVRVHRVGICGTDLHAFEGTQPFFSYPRILGHELGVEIIEVGENPYGLRVGDRCAVEPYLNCGKCVACRKGKSNCCDDLRVLGVHVDGGMRDCFTVAVAKLHRSEQLSYEQLALVETLGIGGHAVERAQLDGDDLVLVLGLGPIGLSVIEFAKVAGATIVAADISEKRRAFGKKQMGVEVCLHAGDSMVEEIKNVFGHLPTAVFDCTGNPQSMTKAFRYIANGGRLIFVGFYSGDLTFHDQEFHRRETTLMGSRNSCGEDFERIIQLLEEKKIDTTPWITHRIGCEKMPEVFGEWLDPDSGVVKAMVEWG